MPNTTFSDRLKSALTGAKIRPANATKIATEFNLRYHGRSVSAQAVRKWLEGKSLPAPDKIVALANWLGVTPAWLFFGDETAVNDCKFPQLCNDFGRLTKHHQATVLELIQMMLKA